MKRARAFTLVEIMIVVVLLAVLAAIVLPAIGKGNAMAKESALASNMSLLRRFMLIYKCQHLEVSPGYPNGDTSVTPADQAFRDQAMLSSKASGQTAPVGTADYPYGPYLSKIPRNPFNEKDTILMLSNGQAFPVTPDDQHGWVCKPETGEIRPGNAGTDLGGVAYYDY